MADSHDTSASRQETFLFTSESVGEGHSDKMCDQISDAILDAYLECDPYAEVNCIAITKTGMIFVIGEILSKAVIDIEEVVRGTLQEVGYDCSERGLDYRTCNVLLAVKHNHINSSAVREKLVVHQQGIIFGYATDEAPELLPFTILAAHRLNDSLEVARKTGVLPWLGPDTKTQVTAEYQLVDGALVPIRIDTIVITAQHSASVCLEEVRSTIRDQIIDKAIPMAFLDVDTQYLINPSGPFSNGGPRGDAGLTGRKIVVDTYGGWGSHGGYAFSGKDCSKIDRTAGYFARWIAKSLVHAGLARRCLIQLAYAPGVEDTVSILIDSYGTSLKSTDELMQIVRNNFDPTLEAMVEELNLRRPIFRWVGRKHHFMDQKMKWEIPKKLIL